MEMLKVLEQKIVALAAMVKDLKNEKNVLIEESKKLELENKQLRAEVAQVSAELEDVHIKMRILENSVLKEHEQSSKDSEEARAAVDELIKSIEFLVSENQQ